MFVVVAVAETVDAKFGYGADGDGRMDGTRGGCGVGDVMCRDDADDRRHGHHDRHHHRANHCRLVRSIECRGFGHR